MIEHSPLTTLILLSLSTAAISQTVTRGSLLAGFRGRMPPGLATELLNCPYCLAHWVAGVLVLLTVGVSNLGALVLIYLATIGLAAVILRLMEGGPDGNRN